MCLDRPFADVLCLGWLPSHQGVDPKTKVYAISVISQRFYLLIPFFGGQELFLHAYGIIEVESTGSSVFYVKSVLLAINQQFPLQGICL